MSANLADPTSSEEKEINILFVGLKGSGKTTLRLKTAKECEDPPRIFGPINAIGFGFKVEYNNVAYYLWETSWDDSGNVTGLDLRSPDEPIHGLIYVVDSSNRVNIEEAKQFLVDTLQKNEFDSIPLQVLANKQDLPDVMTAEEITDRLGLHELEDCRWNVKETVAVSEAGLYDTLEWLSTQI